MTEQEIQKYRERCRAHPPLEYAVAELVRRQIVLPVGEWGQEAIFQMAVDVVSLEWYLEELKGGL